LEEEEYDYVVLNQSLAIFPKKGRGVARVKKITGMQESVKVDRN
jgi:hypothetical protein